MVKLSKMPPSSASSIGFSGKRVFDRLGAYLEAVSVKGVKEKSMVKKLV
jgi:hypothetical protein